MDNLVRGIQDFQSKEFPKRKKRFEELASGQFPETLLISCSDSRVDPTLFLQKEPGEVFTIENAGNIVPDYERLSGGEAATIEYAMRALTSVTDIVVCGHSRCGAMGGLLNLDGLDNLPAVRKWLGYARSTLDRVEKTYNEEEHGDKTLYTVKINTLCQLENLRTHPSVAERLEAGTISLHAWVYQFETGDVLAYDPQANQFVTILDLPPGGSAIDASSLA